jgi:exopolysaccharide biosynthesis polyprenyl glycosylphosphotransferase
MRPGSTDLESGAQGGGESTVGRYGVVSSGESRDRLALRATSATSGTPKAAGLAARTTPQLEPYAVSEPQGSRGRMRRGWLVRRMLLAADLIALSAAFAIVEAGFRDRQIVGHVGIGVETAIFLGLLPAWVLAAKLYGLYDRDEERATYSTADEVVSVFHLVTVGVWLFYATSWLVGLSNPDQAKLATFWFLALVSVAAARTAARTIARQQSAYVQNAVIIGAGEVGQLIGRKLLQHPEYRINLVGFVDAEPRAKRRDLGDVPILGTPEQIAQIVDRNGVDRVIVAFSRDSHEHMLELLRTIGKDDVHIDLVPRLFEAVSANVGIHTLEGLPLLGLSTSRISRSSRFLKRGLDLIGSAVLLAVLAPLMLVISLLIRRDSPGPVFFRQTRLGMDLHEFTLLKFRTMNEGTDEAPHREYVRQIMRPDATPGSNNLYKLDRDDSTTRIGRWLRKTSLDELPQLINVLRGEMSLVGPRPLIPYELDLFSPHHFERFLVPAGITGLWQVEARAHSTFGEALDLDVAYARGWSLGLDLRLLLRTPLLIFRKRETG